MKVEGARELCSDYDVSCSFLSYGDSKLDTKKANQGKGWTIISLEDALRIVLTSIKESVMSGITHIHKT